MQARGEKPQRHDFVKRRRLDFVSRGKRGFVDARKLPMPLLTRRSSFHGMTFAAESLSREDTPPEGNSVIMPPSLGDLHLMMAAMALQRHYDGR
jgi:hypothetical protein